MLITRLKNLWKTTNRTRVLSRKGELDMGNIIKGMNVLEQIPIKEYTTLSGIFQIVGISIAIIVTMIFFIKQKPIGAKILLFFYVLGLVMAVVSVIRFPWFYVETGRYTYKCTLEDDISANYISNNFNVVSVKDGVWTIEDKQEFPNANSILWRQI